MQISLILNSIILRKSCWGINCLQNIINWSFTLKSPIFWWPRLVFYFLSLAFIKNNILIFLKNWHCNQQTGVPKKSIVVCLIKFNLNNESQANFMIQRIELIFVWWNMNKRCWTNFNSWLSKTFFINLSLW